MVPAAFAVNDRLLVPPGARTLAHVSFVTVVVVGDVGVVVPLPHPTVIPTRHAIAIRFVAIMGA
jgi:hypothetical protein